MSYPILFNIKIYFDPIQNKKIFIKLVLLLFSFASYSYKKESKNQKNPTNNITRLKRLKRSFVVLRPMIFIRSYCLQYYQYYDNLLAS